jgi:hypothetical protein
VTAVALCASALFVTGCGREAACWAKYEALAGELAAVTAMTNQDVHHAYTISFDLDTMQFVDEQGVAYSTYALRGESFETAEARVRDGVLAHIRSQFPDC